MKFKIEVKFSNPSERYQCTVRVIDEKDWPIEMGILKAMVASGEVESFTVSMESLGVISMGQNLRNLAERMEVGHA